MSTSAQPANPAQPLIDLQPRHDFFIGVDSDGCAFDSMEIKHKECFIPPFIKHFGLQPIAKYAREAAEFTNLYSNTRGANRFPTYLRAIDLLADRAEVQARNFAPPSLPAMRHWLEVESKPGHPTLATAIDQASGDARAELKQFLAWSLEVNERVEDLVHGVPPFPLMRESLEKAALQADIVVVSATPCEALQREWAEHGLDSLVRVIAGQEMGKKAEHLQLATEGKYDKQKVLMIGDAPGDMQAAKANDVLYYPILPNNEEHAWDRFYNEALDRFFAGTYAGDYEAQLIEDFLKLLPEQPSW